MGKRTESFCGIVLRAGNSLPTENLSVSSQTNPQNCYVYGHFDLNGVIFYVGKGTDKRAWSDDRHPLWLRYVEKHLNGRYEVRILADCLSSEDAEMLESELIAHHGEQLVNWVNYGRMSDFKLIERFHELRDANRETLKSTRALETKDMNLASQNYRAAIEKISKYAFLEFEPGLVGRLLREENEEFGYNGELIALDRLTLCLIKSGKPEEASVAAQDYFSRYRRDALLSGAKKIQERIRKAIERQNRKSK